MGLSPTSAHGSGGFAVTCQLLAPNIDVSMAGTNALKWSALQDNPWNENTLLAIPTGLGLAFAFDGTDSTITTTAAGTWAFSLALAGQTEDADWTGYYDDGLWGQSRIADTGGVVAHYLIVSSVMDLPSGAQLQPAIFTNAPAAIAQSFNADLLATRLA